MVNDSDKRKDNSDEERGNGDEESGEETREMGGTFDGKNRVYNFSGPSL